MADRVRPGEMCARVEDIQKDIESLVTRVEKEITPSRERSLVITKLQEAYLWLEVTPLV